MYEFTMKGMWFRWDLLDLQCKRLAGASLAAAVVAAAPLTVMLGSKSYAFGFALGSGGAWPSSVLPPLPVWAVWWTLGFAVVSGALWHRFSLRQDEMFNRVQNWSYAMAGVWSATIYSVWALFDLADVLPPIPPGLILLIFSSLNLVFWVVAARRWA